MSTIAPLLVPTEPLAARRLLTSFAEDLDITYHLVAGRVIFCTDTAVTALDIDKNLAAVLCPCLSEFDFYMLLLASQIDIPADMRREFAAFYLLNHVEYDDDEDDCAAPPNYRHLAYTMAIVVAYIIAIAAIAMRF